MIIDCFTYNGEADLLEIRLNILDAVVDQFVIVEAPTTFSGKEKPLYFERDRERFSEWANKIKYFVVDENYTPKELALAESSPNTQGAAHWKHEFLQKESIKKALTHLEDKDLVFIGDVDEIWNPDITSSYVAKNAKDFTWFPRLRLKVYSYWLDTRSSEEFYGVIVGTYGNLKDKILNHLRSNPKSKSMSSMHRFDGWHFTSMGGVKELERKLTDSYTEESYATPQVLQSLKENVDNSRDFLGRDFTYRIDESEWPAYLKENREKYAHLCTTAS